MCIRDRGHAVAQLNLGWIYANSPSRKNWEQAVYWYKQAAEQGDPRAQYNLALSLIHI